MYRFLLRKYFYRRKCFSSMPSNLLLCLFLQALLGSLVAVSRAIFIISYRERPRFPRYAENNRSSGYIFRAMHLFFATLRAAIILARVHKASRSHRRLFHLRNFFIPTARKSWDRERGGGRKGTSTLRN